MNDVRTLRFVLRELTAAAEELIRQSRIPGDTTALHVALLKARNELGELGSGKPTPAIDPIDDITAEDFLAQIIKVAETQAGKGEGFPAALLCQSEEARAETRKRGMLILEGLREHERYLRKCRTGDGVPMNTRAFFFEG